MRVSPVIEPSEAVIAIGIPHLGKSGKEQFLKELAATLGKFVGHRRMGAAALDMAGVAGGQYAAYYERGVSSWDIAAGIALVREAGGFVTDLKGGQDLLAKNAGICAGNETIQKALLKVVGD